MAVSSRIHRPAAYTAAVLMILYMQYGSYEGSAAFDSAVYVIPNWLGPVLMGIALSLRERADNE